MDTSSWCITCLSTGTTLPVPLPLGEEGMHVV
jgi:hypothetical protein